MEARVPKKFEYNPTTGFNYLNTGIVDSEKGHIMALELGGPDVPENIVPQWAKWQGSGEWRRLEVELAKDAEKQIKAGQLLQFDCLVLYFAGYKDVRLVSEKKLCVPRGFKVQTSILDSKGTLIAGPTIRFDKEQMRDQTDDMLALREMEKMEQDDDPSFRMKDMYDDVTEKTKKGKKSLAFTKTGQDPIYTPPPVVYTPKTPLPSGSNLFALNTKMSDQSNTLSLRQRFLNGEFNMPAPSTDMDLDT